MNLIKAMTLLMLGTLWGRAQAPLEGLDATLWTQTATEWVMSCTQTWRLAETQMAAALKDPAWTAALEQTGDFAKLPPAVIVDIDETVLDNSPFKAVQIVKKLDYSLELWDEWVKQRSAKEIPGAVAFAQKAKALGVVVFYVTNRACSPRDGAPCPQEEDTLVNLKNLGFPDVSPERILLKDEQPDWVSEKQSGRVKVASTHRILLLVGDDLGDFLPGVKSTGAGPAKRLELSQVHQAWWGERWLILPNPVYGSWLKALGSDKTSYLRGF